MYIHAYKLALDSTKQSHPNNFLFHLPRITAVYIVCITITQEGCSLLSRINEQWPSEGNIDENIGILKCRFNYPSLSHIRDLLLCGPVALICLGFSPYSGQLSYSQNILNAVIFVCAVTIPICLVSVYAKTAELRKPSPLM